MHDIIYELGKIFSNKITIYIFLICFIINGFVICKKPDGIRGYDTNKKQYDEMYSRLSGEIKDEDVDYITDKYNELYVKFASNSFSQEYNSELLTGYEASDFSIYSEMYEKYQYILNYEKTLETLREKSEENAVYYKQVGKKDLQEYNENIVKTYVDRNITKFYETKNYKYYLGYSFSNLCILLTLIAGIHSIFSGERENKMNTLILTSKYGKSKVFRNKLCAGIITGVIVAGAFLIEDFILFVTTFDLKGMLEPVYSIEEMQYCIYDVSILKYILILGSVKLIGVLILVTFIMLASAVSSSNLFGIVLAILGLLPMIIFNRENGVCNVIRLLQINEDASKMNCISVMGSPVIYINFSIITCIVFACVCIVLGYLVETQYGRVFRRERI